MPESSYTSLNDAAKAYPELRGLSRGNTQIWYTNPKHFSDFALGFDSAVNKGTAILPTAPEDLSNTHILLGSISEDGIETIFKNLQEENWSPLGEAKSLIEGLGLKHTSMSIGDIIVKGGILYMVDNTGYINLNDHSSREASIEDAFKNIPLEPTEYVLSILRDYEEITPQDLADAVSEDSKGGEITLEEATTLLNTIKDKIKTAEDDDNTFYTFKLFIPAGQSEIDLFYNPTTKEVKEVRRDLQTHDEEMIIYPLSEFDPEDYGGAGEVGDEFLEYIIENYDDIGVFDVDKP